MKTTHLTRLFSTAALVAAVTAPALAQEEAGAGVFGVEGLSASVSLDVVTQYFFRGYEQQDEGLIFQPGAELSLAVSDSEDVDVSVYVGAWESIHAAPGAAATDSPGSWYESDLYGGVVISTGMFDFGIGYTGYFYPSDVLSEIHELNFSVSFDDSEYLGDYALNPYIMYALEIENDNTAEVDYIEIGGAMSFDLTEEFDLPVTLDVPLTLGLSADDYYVDTTGNEEIFGYFSVGGIVTIPMSELIGTEDHIGGWDLYGGVTLYLLNSEVVLKDGTDNDSFAVVGSIGIGREW